MAGYVDQIRAAGHLPAAFSAHNDPFHAAQRSTTNVLTTAKHFYLVPAPVVSATQSLENVVDVLLPTHHHLVLSGEELDGENVEDVGEIHSRTDLGGEDAAAGTRHPGEVEVADRGELRAVGPTPSSHDVAEAEKPAKRYLVPAASSMLHAGHQSSRLHDAGSEDYAHGLVEF